jgi:hypothetical protein
MQTKGSLMPNIAHCKLGLMTWGYTTVLVFVSSLWDMARGRAKSHRT